MSADDRIAVSFVDLPAAAFPIKVEMYSVETNELVHTINVPGPGAIHVPGQAILGTRVWIRVTTPDGFSDYSAETPEEFRT